MLGSKSSVREVPSFSLILPPKFHPSIVTERILLMENHTINVGEHPTPSTSSTPRKKTHTQMQVKKRNGSFEQWLRKLKTDEPF